MKLSRCNNAKDQEKSITLSVYILESIKIIPHRDGFAYAHETKLGWCTVGLIPNVGYQNSLKFHRFAKKEVSTRKLALCDFIIEN